MKTTKVKAKYAVIEFSDNIEDRAVIEITNIRHNLSTNLLSFSCGP